jgi:hypothetical protein
MTRRNAAKHAAHLSDDYDRAYEYTSNLRGHSRRDLGSAYAADRVSDGFGRDRLLAVIDGIEDAIEDAAES